MTRPHFAIGGRPGLRALVLGLSGALVIGTAMLVSLNVSGHLEGAGRGLRRGVV
jgi:hypothetical protein